jgi:hypothetical protein
MNKGAIMNSREPDLLERREIEAQIAVPLIKGYIAEVGRARAIEIATKVIQNMTREAGQQTAVESGSNTLADLAKVMQSWSHAGILEEEILEQSETAYAFNVTRCQFAERYEALGVREFGYCLSCCRDQPFIEGFNPKIRFQRTQTIMEGASICDFRLTVI